MNKHASRLIILLVCVSLTACGQRKIVPATGAPVAAVQTHQTASPVNTQAAPTQTTPSQPERKQLSRKKVEHPTGKTRSCSTRVNGGAVVSASVAIGLTFAAGFFGPLLFVPAIIAGINATEAAKTNKLLRAAMKIVLKNSNNNQLVGYADDFLDKKKKIVTKAEMRAFDEAKESLEKKVRKELHATRKQKIFIPDVEFAERVFVYDLRGDICEGGLKDFDTTVDLIEDQTLANQIQFRTTDQCEGTCGVNGSSSNSASGAKDDTILQTSMGGGGKGASVSTSGSVGASGGFTTGTAAPNANAPTMGTPVTGGAF